MWLSVIVKFSVKRKVYWKDMILELHSYFIARHDAYHKGQLSRETMLGIK